MSLVLASTSRYRKALLARLGIPFEALAPGVDEAPFQASIADPSLLATTLAEAKARAGLALRPDALVIGSDQVAEAEGRILEKPGTLERAREQLGWLAGREHRLHCAVTLASSAGLTTDLVVVRLRMRPLDEATIDRYLRADEPYDCCGSYRIESRGIALFDAIETSDATAIEGLPMLLLSRRLREAGLQLP